ncbi:MAG: hypothetical protein RIB32_02610 [Phycisphaerales bacterium]
MTRSLAALGFVTVVLLLASIIDPGSSPAAPEMTPIPEEEAPKSLGSLVGPAYSAYMFSSPDGARYTIFDAEGRMIVRSASAQDVQKTAPEYNLPDLRAAIGEVDETDIAPDF